MALQTIPGGLLIPLLDLGASASYVSTTAMTASTHQIAEIFQIPKSGNIHKIGFRVGTVTADANSTLSVTLQTVSETTGNPTGTAYKGAAAGTSSTGISSSAWIGPVTLGTDATSVVRGDVVAVVITFGTFTAADSIPISVVLATQQNFPYVDYYNGSTWAKVNAVGIALDIEYDDGTYAVIPGNCPFTAITSQSFASNTAGTDEYALSFQLPFPARLRAVKLYAALNGDANIILYSGITALDTITTDKDIRGTGNNRLGYYEFATPQVLTKGTVYRVSVQPQTTTSVILPILTLSSAAAMDGLDGGQNFRLGTRLDGGAWDADTTTKRPAIGLHFDQFDDGASTGSGGPMIMVE